MDVEVNVEVLLLLLPVWKNANERTCAVCLLS